MFYVLSLPHFEGDTAQEQHPFHYDISGKVTEFLPKVDL